MIMAKSTQESLAHARAAILRCERRIKRTVTLLKKYRRREAYYVRKQADETKAALQPVSRKFDLEG